MSTEIEHDLEVSLGTLRVLEVGQGEPLILIHGAAPGATGQNNFGSLVHSFSGRRVLVVDLPGHGESRTSGSAALQAEEIATVVLEALDLLNLTAVDVVGLATGGAVGLELALGTPNRVRSLTLINSAGALGTWSPGPTAGLKALLGYFEGGGPTKEKMRAYLQASVADQSLVTDALVEERYAQSLSQQLQSKVVPAGSPPLWARIGGVSVRTQIIWGAANQVQLLDSALHFVRQIPGADLTVLSGVGLAAPLEAPERVAKLVSDFLERG